MPASPCVLWVFHAQEPHRIFPSIEGERRLPLIEGERRLLPRLRIASPSPLRNPNPLPPPYMRPFTERQALVVLNGRRGVPEGRFYFVLVPVTYRFIQRDWSWLQVIQRWDPAHAASTPDYRGRVSDAYAAQHGNFRVRMLE